MTVSIIQRMRQLKRAIAARPPSPTELVELRGVLLPRQFDLFCQLPRYEQRHALNVYYTLRQLLGQATDTEAMQAALLHDCGKFDPATRRSIPVCVKVANVALLSLGGGKLLLKLTSDDPKKVVGYYFWLQLTHEARSVALLQEAGSSARVLRLITPTDYADSYADVTTDPAFAALRRADDLN